MVWGAKAPRRGGLLLQLNRPGTPINSTRDGVPCGSVPTDKERLCQAAVMAFSLRPFSKVGYEGTAVGEDAATVAC